MSRAFVLLSAVALVTTGCTKPKAAPLAPRDIYLWKITDPQRPGAHGYILGSIHLTTEGAKLDAALLDAFATTNVLAVEIDVEALSMRELAAAFEAHGTYPENERLVDHLGQADYERLQRILQQRKLGVANLEQTRPWVLAFLLVSTTASAGGSAQVGMGVDRYFIALARAQAKKPVRSLETLEEQLTALSSATDGLQLEMLRDAIASAERGEAPLERLVDAYLAGNAEAEVTSAMAQDNPDLAAFYDVLLVRRNRHMAARIAALLAEGAQPFVVVGAAHLFGEEGVPRLLAEAGLEVEPVGPKGELVAIEPPPESGAALPDALVLERHVRWPAPPEKRRLEVQGNVLDLEIAEVSGVRYVFMRSEIGAGLVLSLDMLYEQSRLSIERQLGGTTVWAEPAVVSGVPAERFLVRGPTVEVRGTSVWADGTLYNLTAVVPVGAAPPPEEQIQAFADGFVLEVRSPEEAAASREAVVQALASPPPWLAFDDPCPAGLTSQAQALTPRERPPCRADARRCLEACKDGDAVSCLALGDTFEGVEARPRGVAGLFMRSCRLGLVEGCTSEAAAAFLDDARQPEWACAVRTFDLACERKEPWACAFAAAARIQGRGVAADRDEAARLIPKACALDASHQACAMSRRLEAGDP